MLIRLGIAGYGIAAMQVIPDLKKIADKVKLTALADVRRGALEAFQAQNPDVRIFDTVEAMCASDEVDAVWIATPNNLHAPHAIMAAERGKHVICEKPMAVTIEECQAIADAVARNGVKYVQGHSKVFEQSIRKMRQIITSGELGRVTQISSWNYNDWLIRALTPTEVDTFGHGSGPVLRQGPHQTDIVRFLGGGMVRSVKAMVGRWEPNFPKTESNYSALLDFEDGTMATMAFNAQGYFDITELTWAIGEGGKKRVNADSVAPRERPPGPISPEEKYALVAAGNPYGYGKGAGDDLSAPRRQPFFGLTVVSCERGVLRQSPDGIYVYGEEGRREVPVSSELGRAAELVELHDAITQDRPAVLDAAWGMATLEVCVAILRSADERREIMLRHQSPTRDIPGW
jgi:phthalate 4,5-cis-dihydrodiol dehydrogenase